MASITTVSRDVQFLNESNHIEGIYEIDYARAEFLDPNKGHFGAFVQSQQAALEHTPLSAKMIRCWQAMLGREQQQYTNDHIADEEIGHIRGPALQKNVRIGNHIPPHYDFVPLHLMNLIEDINEGLRKNHEIYKKDNGAFTQFLGSAFFRFEKIHPFGDGNGRTGRLLANYIATYCGRPFLVFPSEMSLRNRYIEAHDSEEKMAQYMLNHLKPN